MSANRGRIALVLAGGGLTGATYEVGALRAIDDLLVDRTVNDFDIYIDALYTAGPRPHHQVELFA